MVGEKLAAGSRNIHHFYLAVLTTAGHSPSHSSSLDCSGWDARFTIEAPNSSSLHICPSIAQQLVSSTCQPRSWEHDVKQQCQLSVNDTLGDTLGDTMVPCCCGALQVYLHEIADPRYQALTGSLGYISLGIGVVIGILAVVMIVSLVHGGEATTAATCSATCGLQHVWPADPTNTHHCSQAEICDVYCFSAAL